MNKKILLVLVVVFCAFFSASAQNAVLKVACIGNSITEGFGRDNSSSYPNQLDTLLGDTYNVRNFGKGGTTLLKNGDYPYWEDPVFELALEFEPDIVIISLGTNDSKPQNWVYEDEFYSDYADLVNVFRSLHSRPEIFVCFPPPVFQDGYGITNSIIRDEIIPLIDSVRTTLHTFHINFYDPMLGMSALFPDGIHPDAMGYREMSRIAAQAILVRPSGVIKYFFADPAVIEETGTATLYWDTSDSSTVTLDGGPVGIKDSLNVSPAETKNYTLIASGEFNDTSVATVTFLASGLIKSFRAHPPILEKDLGDSSVLIWETTNNSLVRLNEQSVNQNDSLIVHPDETMNFTLMAEGVQKDTQQVTIAVLDAQDINRSLLAESYKASSTEYLYSVQAAFDGSAETYWLSEGHLTEWISADLGQEIYIDRVKIIWGEVYASSYRLEILDAANKLTIFTSTTTGDGEIDDISREAVKGKQVRLLFIKSSSSVQGYMVKELEIYGSAKTIQQITPERLDCIPKEYGLYQNIPNPFNPATTIRYALARPAVVYLDLYDIRGLHIKRLVHHYQSTGEYLVRFDGSNLSSGIYFYRLRAGTFEHTRRMLILK
jgi:acyl-CoA thioesterase I